MALIPEHINIKRRRDEVEEPPETLCMYIILFFFPLSLSLSLSLSFAPPSYTAIER
jgi:hypothetical protein